MSASASRGRAAKTEFRVLRSSERASLIECRLHSVQEFGDTRAEFVVGEVLVFHFRDGLVEGGKVDTRRLDPLARLGGPHYAALAPISLSL